MSVLNQGASNVFGLKKKRLGSKKTKKRKGLKNPDLGSSHLLRDIFQASSFVYKSLNFILPLNIDLIEVSMKEKTTRILLMMIILKKYSIKM